jgi:hypothetical protein
MAWSARLSTFSTKKKMFTHVCDLSGDAPVTASLPERLELTFTLAAPELHRLPCFYLTAAVPTADKAVANNLLELGTFLQKQDRHKVAQMKLPGGRSFNLCAVHQGLRTEELSTLQLECRVQEAESSGGETWHAGGSADDAVRRGSASSMETTMTSTMASTMASATASAATAGSSQVSAIEAMQEAAWRTQGATAPRPRMPLPPPRPPQGSAFAQPKPAACIAFDKSKPRAPQSPPAATAVTSGMPSARCSAAASTTATIAPKHSACYGGHVGASRAMHVGSGDGGERGAAPVGGAAPDGVLLGARSAAEVKEEAAALPWALGALALLARNSESHNASQLCIEALPLGGKVAGGKADGKAGGKVAGKAGGKAAGRASVRGSGPPRDESAEGAGGGVHALLVQDNGVGLGYAEVRELLWHEGDHGGVKGTRQRPGGEARHLADTKRSQGGQCCGSAEAGRGAEPTGMGYAERLWLGALRVAEDCLLLSQTAQGCCAALIATRPATQRACGSKEPLRSPLLLPLVCWGGNLAPDGARREGKQSHELESFAAVRGQTGPVAQANLSRLLQGLRACGGAGCDRKWLDEQMRLLAGTGTRLVLFNLTRRRDAPDTVELQWKVNENDLTLRTASCGWKRAGPPSTELPPPTAYSARALLARLWYVPRLTVRLCGATVEARPARGDIRVNTASEVALTLGRGPPGEAAGPIYVTLGCRREEEDGSRGQQRMGPGAGCSRAGLLIYWRNVLLEDHTKLTMRRHRPRALLERQALP